MPKKVEVHSAALAEADAAASWYAERNVEVARAFLDEFRSALRRIAENPEAWPVESARARRCLLRRFPFRVVFTVAADRCLVVAVGMCQRV